MPRHKKSNCQRQRENLKEARGTGLITSVRLTAGFSSEAMETGRQRNELFKVLTENGCWLRTLSSKTIL